MCQESGQDRRDERGMQQRFQGAGPLGIDRVQAVHRLVQLDAEFHLPAHAVKVGDLSWADPRWEICQEETIAFGRLHADEAERQRMCIPTDMDISITSPAVEDESVVCQECLAGRSRGKTPASLAPERCSPPWASSYP